MEIKIVKKYKQVTIPANGIINNQVINANDISGYYPVGIVGVLMDYPNVMFPTIFYINYTGEIWFDIRSFYGENLTAYASFFVMYISNGFSIS